MRISDWSSDVCSSDLAACASSNGNSNESMVSPVARNAGRSTAFEAPSIGPAPVATNVTRSCHADVIDLHLKGRTIVMKDRPMRAVLIAAPLLVQIGRASCRERVCQYV